jgi:ribosomal-protein-alanine N-acetyltransferase
MESINFSPFPHILTQRLRLRKVVTTDASDIFSLRSDERVMEFLDRPMQKTMGDSRQLIKIITNGINNNEAITWAINLKNDPKLIGTIGFWRIIKEHFRAEIGYLLHPDYQGKGIMQEALEEVLDFGFRTLKLHSIEANVNPNNLASIKLLERNRFIKEAYFKENYYYDGKFLDTAIYSLINIEDNR